MLLYARLSDCLCFISPNNSNKPTELSIGFLMCPIDMQHYVTGTFLDFSTFSKMLMPHLVAAEQKFPPLKYWKD